MVSMKKERLIVSFDLFSFREQSQEKSPVVVLTNVPLSIGFQKGKKLLPIV